MTPPLQPRLVPAAAPAGRARPDVGLLLLLLSIHAIPLVALLAGRPWGTALQGYAVLVMLAAGRELVHELRAWGDAAAPRSRA